MTKPNPQGPISNALNQLVECFKLSAEFVKLMKAADADEAAGRIYRERVALSPSGVELATLDELKEARPFICIWADPGDALSIGADATGSSRCGGTIRVYGEVETTDAKVRYPEVDLENESELFRWWDNSIGLTLWETFSSGSIQTLLLRSMPNLGIWRNEPERRTQLGDYFAFQAAFEWGRA